MISEEGEDRRERRGIFRQIQRLPLLPGLHRSEHQSQAAKSFGNNACDLHKLVAIIFLRWETVYLKAALQEDYPPHPQRQAETSGSRPRGSAEKSQTSSLETRRSVQLSLFAEPTFGQPFASRQHDPQNRFVGPA